MDNLNLITALVIAALITLAVTAAGCTTTTSPSPPAGQQLSDFVGFNLNAL
ncbi:MAG TPA: hypothetical protein VEF35_02970 [Candidatus Bathyarchaeia archaeon]|nr:hypothetical protein [Candidatus Bathyarchaeia archaeon]